MAIKQTLEFACDPDPQGDNPSNQTKKGSAQLCCGDITPVGTASRRGANEALAAMSAAPRNPHDGEPTGRNPEPGSALPWASRSKVQPVLDVEILAERAAS